MKDDWGCITLEKSRRRGILKTARDTHETCQNSRYGQKTHHEDTAPKIFCA